MDRVSPTWRLIVDITELAEWQGKPTGVPRVIDELSVRFADDDRHLRRLGHGSQTLSTDRLRVGRRRDEHAAAGSTAPRTDATARRRGWLSEDIYEVMTHDPQTRATFVFLHDATDEELAWLYRHCEFTVYPSFYEGWGLPIGESLAYGVPCLASRTSSMPEVAGELIPYFSPSSADECLKAIRPCSNLEASTRPSA